MCVLTHPRPGSRGGSQQMDPEVGGPAAVLVFAPPFQSLLGTAAPPARYLVLLLPYPLIVWGADELRKFVIRTYAASHAT